MSRLRFSSENFMHSAIYSQKWPPRPLHVFLPTQKLSSFGARVSKQEIVSPRATHNGKHRPFPPPHTSISSIASTSISKPIMGGKPASHPAYLHYTSNPTPLIAGNKPARPTSQAIQGCLPSNQAAQISRR